MINVFTTTMKNFQATQDKYKEKYAKIIQRQYLIVNPNATEVELQKVVEGSDPRVNEQVAFYFSTKFDCPCHH